MKANYFKPAVIGLLIVLNILFIAIYSKMGAEAKSDPESIEVVKQKAFQDAAEIEKARMDAMQDAEFTESVKQEAIANAAEIETIKNSIK